MLWSFANGQYWCGSDFSSAKEKSDYVALLSKSSKKARKGTQYEIYIKPKVIHGQQTPSSLSTAQVFQLIDKLNEVFIAINVKFLIEGNNVEHIYDDNFVDLKTENEGNLRSKYDNKDGINLYFTHTITRPDLSQLNGYTSLPNLSKGSNAILLSYLDNSTASFSLLKEKIICHEFGHYFGLLHTYQDSNHNDISKRELVTRGVGANCSTTGDLLCDTSSDPYERAPSIFSLECTEKLPSNLQDLNGEMYSPPTDNYMSYQEKCGFRFSAMQYQTLESGLNIRLSPLAEYSITKNVTTFISLTNLDKKEYCVGETITINFQKSENFEPKNKIKVEISNKNSENFREITDFEVINESQIKIRTDQTWEEGSNYRLIIKSTLPYSESPISQSFQIKSLPTVEIINSQNTVNSGDLVQIKINFGGSGPWQFKDWDGNLFKGITSNSISFIVPVVESRAFSISEIGNFCGILDLTTTVFVETIKPSILIQSNGEFCNESSITLPTIGIKNAENTDYYEIQIIDNQKIFDVLPIVTPNTVQFNMPKELLKDKYYKLKILGKKLGEFSNTIPFIVKNPPQPPGVITPLKVCSGTENYKLKANGQNLKWYNSESTNNFTYGVLLNTMQPSQKNYYVSQSDSNNCESPRNKIEVIIEDPISGEISGNSNIMLGETAYIHLSLKGSSPWNININEIGNFIINTSETNIAVNPTRNTQYELKNISNYCGVGTTIGVANVLVTTILGNNLDQEGTVKVYPNPVIGKVINYEVIGEEISEIVIISEDGKSILNMMNNNKAEGEIDLQNLSSGKYIIKFKGSRRNYYKKIIK